VLIVAETARAALLQLVWPRPSPNEPGQFARTVSSEMYYAEVKPGVAAEASRAIRSGLCTNSRPIRVRSATAEHHNAPQELVQRIRNANRHSFNGPDDILQAVQEGR
jgi:hypothetical protein